MMGRLLVLLILLFACQLIRAQTTDDILRKIQSTLHQQFLKEDTAINKYLLRVAEPAMFSTPAGTRVLITGVRPDGIPEYRITMNTGSAESTGASKLHVPGTNGISLKGNGLTIAMWDAGMVMPHQEFGERLASNEGNVADTHATHVAGTLIASGVNPNARGMAPGAKAATYFFANDLSVMAGLASTQLISNHSYGAATGWFNAGTHWAWTGNPDISNVEDYRFGFYGSRAKSLDEIAYHAPFYSIFWATGNDRSDVGDGTKPADCNAGTGYDCIIPEAVAKNIFTIGAVSKVPTYTSPVSVVMGNYSSWGPTDDGRIKPDLVAPGTDILSTSATGTDMYELSSGTSMATPAAAGSLALLQELHSRLHGGQYMKSATLKAVAIHTAKEAGSFPGPDYIFGWGLVDVEAGARLAMEANRPGVHLEELTIHDGEVLQIPVEVMAGQKVTATIAWTDPPATPVGNALDPSNLMLVNDLDLRIAGSSGDHAPWILDPLNPSRQAGRGDNFRDNVEKVEFTPGSTHYTVKISHKGTLANGPQDFSLVLTYVATSDSRIFYWVGNSGNWADGSHWSLTSGGPPANVTPSSIDRVVIDEHSLQDNNATITLTENVTVESLIWLAPVGMLQLNEHTLSVTHAATLSANHTMASSGVLRLDGPGGTFAIHGANLPQTKMEFASGKWSLVGEGSVDELMVTGGELHLNSKKLELNRFVSAPESSAKIFPHQSNILLHEATEIDGNVTSLQDNNATLIVQAPDVRVNWNDVVWSGSVKVETGEATLSGNNEVGQITISGKMNVAATTTVGLMELGPGSSLHLHTGVTINADSLTVFTTALEPATISGTGMANMTLSHRRKYCFDHLNISSVKLQGAIASVGTGSVITDAPGWQAGTCEETLFCDFQIANACANGMASLMDVSTGSPTAWAWRVEGPGGVLFEATTRHTQVALPEPGDYIIRLKITRGSYEDVYTKNIQVSVNPQPEFTIAENAGRLFSGHPGLSYQWYRDGIRLNGATERSLPFDGTPGTYYVVNDYAACNRISVPLTISGLIDESTSFAWPNPASSFLHVDAHVEHIEFMNPIGVTWRLKKMQDGNIDITSLPDGMYVLRTRASGRLVTQRVVVQH